MLGSVALAVAVAGCRQIVGITDDPPKELTTIVGGLPFGTPECATCVAANCSDASTACSAPDTYCRTYQTCVGPSMGDAGNAKYRSQCMIGDLGLEPEVSALNACVATHCSGDCALTCGSLVERITPPDASDVCQKECFGQNTNACDAELACAKSPECDAYVRCLVACPTPDCRQACATKYDGGAPIFAHVQQAYTDPSCWTACAYGKNWSCLGHVPPFQTTNLTSMTQTGTILDFLSGNPVGERVDICVSPTSCATCGTDDQPFVMTTTDDAGAYSVTLPITNANNGGLERGFEGCFRLSSLSSDVATYWAQRGFTQAQATSEPIVTCWAQRGFPQTEATWNASASDSIRTVTAAVNKLFLNGMGLPDLLLSRANIGIRVFDCLGNPASDVKVSLDRALDSDGRVCYPQAYNSSTCTNPATVRGSGLVLFLNVPATDAGADGLILTATTDLGQVSSQRVKVEVHAGVISTIDMYPTPTMQ